MDTKLIDYFIEQTNDRFKQLETKVDKVLEFKWQIVGGSVIVSILLTVAINVAVIVWK